MSEREHKGGGHITARMSEREQVEQTADRLRDELLLTLKELERRRERAVDVKRQVRQLLANNRRSLLMLGGGALALVGLGVGVSLWRSRRHGERLKYERWRAFQRAWEHPERVASGAGEQPFPIQLGQRLVFIFITTLASALAKNAVQTLVPSRAARLQSGVQPTQAPASA